MAESLILGAVANEATPTSAAAALYLLSQGYGAPSGTDTPALVETDEVAPVGPVGRTLIRRVTLPFRYAGAVTIRVTVITDFSNIAAVSERAYTAPETPTQDAMEVPVAKTGTYVRARIEIISRTGMVEIFTPTIIHRPLGSAATGVVGPQST